MATSVLFRVSYRLGVAEIGSGRSACEYQALLIFAVRTAQDDSANREAAASWSRYRSRDRGHSVSVVTRAAIFSPPLVPVGYRHVRHGREEPLWGYPSRSPHPTFSPNGYLGAFVGWNVNANVGLLVCTRGTTQAAKDSADSLLGIRLSVMDLDTVASWRPAGTVDFRYAVPSALLAEATREARRAGFRVRHEDLTESHDLPGHTTLSAYRHFGTRSPSGEVQTDAR